MAGTTEEMENAVRYLSITFVGNLKKVLCNNSIYTVEDSELLQCSVLSLLVRAHVSLLSFVFSGLDHEIIASLNI